MTAVDLRIPQYLFWVLPLLIGVPLMVILALGSELIVVGIFLGVFGLALMSQPRSRLALLFLLLPFEYTEFTPTLRGVGPFQVYASLFILLLLLRIIFIDFPKVPRPPVLWIAGIGFLALLPSLLNSIDFSASFTEMGYYLFLLSTAFGIYYYLAYEENEKFLLQIIWLFVFESVLMGLYGIIDAYTRSSIVSIITGRVRFGFFRDANYYASYLLMALSLAIACLLAEKKTTLKIFFSFAVLGLIASIILTISRSGILILLLVLLIYAGYILSIRTRFRALIRFGFPLTLVFIFAFYFFTSYGSKFLDVLTLTSRIESALTGRDPSFGQRLTILDVSLRAVKAHPIIGVGIGTFEKSFAEYRGTNLSTGYGRSVHNTGLRVLAETGLVGFLPSVLFIVSLLVYLVKAISATQSSSWKILLFGLLVSVLSFLMTSMTLDQYHGTHFWVITGLALATATMSYRQKLSGESTA